MDLECTTLYEINDGRHMKPRVIFIQPLLHGQDSLKSFTPPQAADAINTAASGTTAVNFIQKLSSYFYSSLSTSAATTRTADINFTPRPTGTKSDVTGYRLKQNRQHDSSTYHTIIKYLNTGATIPVVTNVNDRPAKYDRRLTSTGRPNVWPSAASSTGRCRPMPTVKRARNLLIGRHSHINRRTKINLDDSSTAIESENDTPTIPRLASTAAINKNTAVPTNSSRASCGNSCATISKFQRWKLLYKGQKIRTKKTTKKLAPSTNVSARSNFRKKFVSVKNREIDITTSPSPPSSSATTKRILLGRVTKHFRNRRQRTKRPVTTFEKSTKVK